MNTIWSAEWHSRLDVELAAMADYDPATARAVRRELARDPIAFARIYLEHHLRDKQSGGISFAEVHYEWAARISTWCDGVPMAPQSDRHAYVAPREMGKSTWWFLIVPLWTAANGLVKFAAAFSHSATQAELHLKTFKHEMESNALLRHDFPELCQPKRRASSGTTVSDTAGMLIQKNGFVFAARGIDSATLGMKVGDQRPDLLILDDVEPDEAKYSPDLAVKRLGTITDAILPLNVYARVIMVGTVTMPGSIMHQLVKSAAGTEHDGWVSEQEIVAHHHHAIIRSEVGDERSVWPEKWPLEFLNKIRHTRMYAKNYENDPMGREGVYWTSDDFRYGHLEGVTRTVLVVDPAVTQRKTSDFSGLCVASWAPPVDVDGKRVRPTKKNPGKVVIRHAVGVKLTGAPLRAYIAEKVLPRFGDIRFIQVETNQGGDLWAGPGGVLTGLGVKCGTRWARDSKEIRFARELDHWQRGRVQHAVRLPVLEEQCVAFPNAAYDDVVDAAVAAVSFFLSDPFGKVRVSARSESYV